MTGRGLGGRNLPACLAGILVAGISCGAQAETSASFQASATIVAGCEVNGELPASGQALGQIGILDFGEHSGLSTASLSASLSQNAGLTLICTPGVALSMSVDGGLHGNGIRNMQISGGLERLPYRLYRDPAFSQELSVSQAVPVAFSTPTQIALPIYGRLTLPAGSLPGTYSDTVVVTLNW